MALTLEEIDEAIRSIREDGQSFTVGDITYSQGSLGELIKLRESLVAEEGRASGSRPVFRAFKMSGMGY